MEIHPDENFISFIKTLLKKANLKDKYINILTNMSCVVEWTKVFTSIETDPIYNYELYKMFGDVTVNKIIVWYYKQRFSEEFNKPHNKIGNLLKT